ncbi:MAG: hypothetical protein ACI936_000305 [Paraglaciecola sp.]|jgi:hypothetical protein
MLCIQVAEYLLDHQWMFIRHIPLSNPCGAAFAVQIIYPDDLSMLAITLTAPSTVRKGGKPVIAVKVCDRLLITH